MTSNNSASKNGLKKKIVLGAIALVVVLAAVIGVSYFTQAQDAPGNFVAEHIISYTQDELVALVQNAFESAYNAPEELEADTSPLADAKGEFDINDETTEHPDDVIAGDIYVSWVQEQLADKLLLDTITQEDGCTAYVALDVAQGDIVLVAVNPNNEIHAFTLRVEGMDDLHVQVDSFELVPVIVENEDAKLDEDDNVSSSSENEDKDASEAETTDKTEEDTSNTNNADASSTSKEKDEPAEKPADTTDDGATEEAAVDAADDSAQTSEASPVGTAVVRNSAGPQVMLLSAGKTYGDIDAASKETAEEQEEASGASQVETTSGEVDSQTNDTSEAQTDPENKTANSEDAEPVVKGFVIDNLELQENSSETAEGNHGDAQVVLPSNSVGTIKMHVGYIDSGKTLNEAIDDGTLVLTPSAEVQLTSRAMHVVPPHKGTMKVFTEYKTGANGVKTYVNKAMYNNVTYILDKDSIIKCGAATIQYWEFFVIELHNTEPVTIKAIDFASVGLVEVALVIKKGTDEAKPFIVNNPDGIGINIYRGTFKAENGAVVEAKGKTGGIWTKYMGVYGGADVNAKVEPKNPDHIAANITEELFVTGYSRLWASGGGTGIQCETMVIVNDYVLDNHAGTEAHPIPGDGAFEYGDGRKTSENNTSKSRIIGDGTNYGIKFHNSGNTGIPDYYPSQLFTGTNTLVIGRGVAIAGIAGNVQHVTGTMPACAWNLTRKFSLKSTDNIKINGKYEEVWYKEKATIYAESIFGNGYQMANRGDLNIHYGVRLIAAGGRYGLYGSTTEAQYDVHAWHNGEIIAQGEEAGIYLTRDNKSSNTYIYLRAWSGGHIYGKSGENGTHGIYVDYGCAEAFFGGKTIKPEDTTKDPPVETVPKDPNTGDPPQEEIIESGDAGTGSSYMVGIGGIPNASMVNNSGVPATVDIIGGTYPQNFLDMPTPKADENGLMPYKKGSYGIQVAAYGYVASYDKGTIAEFYGGQYGAVTGVRPMKTGDPTASSGTYIVAYEGGYLEARGGNGEDGVGVSARTYVHVWSYDETKNSGLAGNSTMLAFGGKYGIEARGEVSKWGYVTTYSFGIGQKPDARPGVSYIYAFGRDAGIWAKDYVLCAHNSQMVAETVVAVNPKTTADSQPAIMAHRKYALDKNNFINTCVDGTIHEIYQVKDLNIVSMPPYQLIKKIPALKTNMGTVNEVVNSSNKKTGEKIDTISIYNWTTPENHPNRDTKKAYITRPGKLSGRDWMDYDSKDDLGLLKVEKHQGIVGLVVYGNAKDATIVADWVPQIREYTNENLSNDGLISGYGNYRMTIGRAKGTGGDLTDRRVTNVEIDLYDKIETFENSIVNIPEGTEYRLTYKSSVPNETGTKEVIIGKNNGLLAAEGKIRLNRLGLGEYWLEPVVNKDIGEPYGTLPSIHFVIQADSTVEVKRASKTSIGSDTPPGRAEVVTAWEKWTSVWANKWKDLPSTFPATNVDVACGMAKIKVFYNREKYEHGLDFKLVDKDSGQPIPGFVKMTVYLDSKELYTKILYATGTQALPVWEPQDAYVGFTYKFEQIADDAKLISDSQALASIPAFIPATGTYTVTLGKTGATNTIGVTVPNASYTSSAQQASPQYIVRAMNDQIAVKVPLYLISEKDANAKIYTNYLKDGGFELLAIYTGSSTPVPSGTITYNEGDGTFVMELKPYFRNYVLKQTKANSKYLKREGTNTFNITATYTTVSGKVEGVVSALTLVSSQPDHGWVKNPDRLTSVYISNTLNIVNGDLDIIVEATGLWAYHDDAVFIVEVRGTDGAAKGKIFYNQVSLKGSAEFNGHKDIVVKGTAEFKDIPTGNYQVEVYPSLRTEISQKDKAVQSVSIKAEANNKKELVFPFDCTNYSFLSGEDAIRNEIEVEIKP